MITSIDIELMSDEDLKESYKSFIRDIKLSQTMKKLIRDELQIRGYWRAKEKNGTK